MLQGGVTDSFDGVGVTKIDHNIAIVHGRFDCVAEIALRHAVDARVAFGKIDNCFPHSAGRAHEQNAQRPFHVDRSNASSVLRKRAWFASPISHNGKRTSLDIAPRHSSAVVTGTGFGSMNKSLKRGNNRRCNFCADFRSPDSYARTSVQTSAGNKFEATLTTPTAPTDMNGSVNESSPLRMVNDSGKRPRNSLTRSTLPLASLIETIFRHSAARREAVSGPISTSQRPGRL